MSEELDRLEVPRMLYRAGGPHALESGDYSLHIAKDREDLAQSLANGWHLDQYAAKAAAEKPAEPVEPEDDAPPTRAELEQKAAELGLRVDKRWGDKRLADEIAAALKA